MLLGVGVWILERVFVVFCGVEYVGMCGCGMWFESMMLDVGG